MTPRPPFELEPRFAGTSIALPLPLFSALTALGLLLVGCGARNPTNGIIVQAGIPGARASAQVRPLGEKSGFIDAEVRTAGIRWC